MAAGTLALPQLHASIPMALGIPGQNALTVPLAIALLEADLITDAMLAPRVDTPLVEVLNGPNARELSMRALGIWWSGIQYPAKHFDWSLHVQELEDYTGTHEKGVGKIGWFCLTRTGRDIPRFALVRRIGELEATLEGFGQTVLAVLADATRYLPDSLDPWRAVNYAECFHWMDSDTDEEMLENMREERGYATAQQVLDDEDVLTRAEFYKDMPRWVTSPRRALSRKAIAAAARTELDRGVIAACDAISAFVCAPGFKLESHSIGGHQFGGECIDGCMVLLWTDGDQVSRVLDDALNHFGECSESSEYIDAHPTPLTAEGIRSYQARTEQMMQLAALTERLLDLIGDPI